MALFFACRFIPAVGGRSVVSVVATGNFIPPILQDEIVVVQHGSFNHEKQFSKD